MEFTSTDWETIRSLLCSLQRVLLDELLRERQKLSTTEMSAISHITIADTIYGIDAVSERLILEWMEKHWPTNWPVELVMEGLEDRDSVTFPAKTPIDETWLRLIIDPIDGTREIMWDRRSAWALAAVAPQKGEATRLSDTQVAAMTELPTTKGAFADQISGVRGRELTAERIRLSDGKVETFPLEPYNGDSLLHGFAGLASPFPGARQIVGAIEEKFYAELESADPHTLPIFNDQYLSTGGQILDLITGRLRFFGDLRPYVFSRQKRAQALCCHPYDVCVALLAELAGVVLESPTGEPLDPPLDTTTPVAWVGFANARLAARARPALHRALEHVLGSPTPDADFTT